MHTKVTSQKTQVFCIHTSKFSKISVLSNLKICLHVDKIPNCAVKTAFVTSKKVHKNLMMVFPGVLCLLMRNLRFVCEGYFSIHFLHCAYHFSNSSSVGCMSSSQVKHCEELTLLNTRADWCKRAFC